MIEATSLTRYYGPLCAVSSLDLLIEAPGIVGLLGENGAGKTSVLRMLAGTLAATSGRATIAGFDVLDAPLEARARVGWLPETPPLHPELTVGEYLAYAAELRGLSRAERVRSVGKLLDELGLVDVERRLIGALSKGFRQRVGLAQALVHDPPVLLLDEPTSGLDPVQLGELRRLVRRLAEERVILLSTHVLQEVSALCERVVVLGRGRLLGDGTLTDLAAKAGLSDGVRVVLSAAPEAATQRLAAVEGVRKVRVLEEGGDSTVYRVEGEGDLAPRLASCAAANRWQVRELRADPVSWDQVFGVLRSEAM